MIDCRREPDRFARAGLLGCFVRLVAVGGLGVCDMVRTVKGWSEAQRRRLYVRLMRHTIIDRRSGCFIYTGPTKGRDNCYGRITIRVNGMPRGISVHRLSYTAFVSTPRADLEVKHGCDRPLCWNPEHLKQGTHITNCREREQAKRQRRDARAYREHGVIQSLAA